MIAEIFVFLRWGSGRASSLSLFDRQLGVLFFSVLSSFLLESSGDGLRTECS